MRILLFYIILFLPLTTLAQEVEDKRSSYPLFELSKGNDNTKNINWGNFHFSNESFRKAADRYEKVDNPSVEIQRKLAKAYIELDSIDKALVMFETIINADEDIETEDFFLVEAREFEEEASNAVENEALIRTVKMSFDNYVRLNKRIPPEMLLSISAMNDESKLSDTLIAHLNNLKLEDKQKLLEDNISIKGFAIRATYNSPFTLPPLRRNESMFSIDWKN